MKKFKKLFEYAVLFEIGGSTYCSMEILFRGYTHWSMFICGGLSLISIGALNEVLPWELPFIRQCLIGGVLITLLELCTGLVFNSNYAIWDYRSLLFNFKGQICIQFSLIWCVLSAFAIVFDDWLRYWIFHEERPHYDSFF